MYVLNQATLLAEAILEIAAGGPFVAPKIAVYTTDVFPGKTTPLSAFTIADFAGLTNKQAVVWGAPFVNDNGQAEVMGAVVNWLTVDATLLPLTAFGYVLLNTAGTVLLLAERFAEPFNFVRAGQQLGLIPRLVFDS